MDFLFLIAEYCLAFIALLVIATLRSQLPFLFSSSSLSLVMSCCLIVCFLIFFLSSISLSSCLLDSVCTSPGLSSGCWITHLPYPVGYCFPETDHVCPWITLLRQKIYINKWTCAIPVCWCFDPACFWPCLLIKLCKWIRTSLVSFAPLHWCAAWLASSSIFFRFV